MPKFLNIFTADDFKRMQSLPLIDVRSPGEYSKGHIPDAVNIPLFNNEERAIVGTLYKQKGKQAAINKGLEIVGRKMASLAEQIIALAPEKKVVIHCWRGGMRSGSVAWLMEMYGLTVYTIKGGYKSFRRLAVGDHEEPLPIVVLGGRTGSAKTLVLEQLSALGDQVIDLEKLAKHKGSSFGSLGEPAQPTQEQFENDLVYCYKTLDPAKRVWVEDESRMIGNKVIPEYFWNRMRMARVMYIDMPVEERVNYLLKEYGNFEKQTLKAAIERIGKRLGPQHVKEALIALEQNDLKRVCEICLVYYDKSYEYGLSQRDPKFVHTFTFHKADPATMALQLITETIFHGNN